MALYAGIEIPGRPSLENVRRLDLLPIPMIRDMQRVGMSIDREGFHRLSSRFRSEMVQLEKDIASYIPHDRLEEFASKATELEEEQGDASLNAASAEQIGKLLFDILHVGSEKQLRMTKAGDRISTGKKQLELIKSDHPVVQKVLDYRERAKLVTTYTERLPLIAKFHPRSVGSSTCPVCELHHDDDTYRVHTEIVTTRAETGRLASRHPNLTNLPARTELGALVRAEFKASPGKRINTRDFAQIELRGLAHCAQAASMIQVYAEDKDIHVYTACEAFGVSYEHYRRLLALKKDQLTKEEKADLDEFKMYKRMPSKNINFAIVYGISAKGLIAQLALSGVLWSEDEANAFIDRWFNLYPEVKDYLELQYYRAKRYGMVWDLFGRVRLVPEVRSFHSWIRSAGLRQAGNMPIQALSAGQLKLTMGKLQVGLEGLREAGVDCHPMIAVHDQLLIETPEEDTGLVDELMEACFENVMRDEETGEEMFRVPVKSDGAVMENWVKG